MGMGKQSQTQVLASSPSEEVSSVFCSVLWVGAVGHGKIVGLGETGVCIAGLGGTVQGGWVPRSLA